MGMRCRVVALVGMCTLVLGLLGTGCGEDETISLPSSSQSSLVSSAGSLNSQQSSVSGTSSSATNYSVSSSAASYSSGSVSSIQSSSVASLSSSSSSSLSSVAVFTVPRGIKNASLLCRDGKAWVAWQSTNDNGFYLAQYDPAGSNWADAGGKISNGDPSGWVAPAVLADAAGNIIVGAPVYVDGATVNNAVWSWNGSTLTQLGGSLNSGVSRDIQLGICTNRIFALWSETTGGMKASLSLFDTGAAAWQAVGSPLFTAGGAYTPSLAFDSSNKPWVAFQDYTQTPSFDATVMAFDGSWGIVGGAAVNAGTVQANDTSLAFDGAGVPYLAYKNWTASQTEIKKRVAGNWTSVTIPTGASGSPQIKSFGGTIYLLAGHFDGISVWRLDGSAWVRVALAHTYAIRYTFGVDSAGSVWLLYGDSSGAWYIRKF